MLQILEEKGQLKRRPEGREVVYLPAHSKQRAGLKALQHVIARKTDFETFFAEAPRINPNVAKITGVICGYRVEAIEDPLMQKIRYLDKLVDELAKGKAMEKILRK